MFKEEVKIFGSDLIKTLIKQLKDKNKSATGRLIKSFDSRVQETADKVNVLINSEEYLKFIDEGRKPGSYPPISEISKWATIKGIPQSAVFAIAKSIFKYGIEPTNIIDKAIAQNWRNNSDKFETSIANKVEDKIIKDLEQ